MKNTWTRNSPDHIDVYLLHNLYAGNWEKVQKYDGLAFLDRMIEKGKILHKAFSIHSTLKAFKEIVDAFDWEMAQIQLNILDEHQQVGVEGLKYAAENGLAVNIMEPLRGGSLLSNAPARVQSLIDAYPDKRSLAEWCFRWLYDMPEVTLVLSGTSSLGQIKDNLRIFESAKPSRMTEEDHALVAKIREAFEAEKSVGCTGCRYCMPCPSGVEIPEIFKLYNSFQLLKPNPVDKIVYQRTVLPAGSGADRCVSCGLCARHCPQGLKIPELLRQAHAELTAGE